MAVSYGAGGLISFGAAADAKTGRVVIKKLRWTGATTAAHVLLVKDTAARVICRAKAQAANDDIEINFPDGLLVNGIVVTTMGSGTLDIYG